MIRATYMGYKDVQIMTLKLSTRKGKQNVVANALSRKEEDI